MKLAVKWDGLDSFQTDLLALATGMAEEAGALLTAAAHEAADAIKAAYPVRTGKLRDGVRLEPSRGLVLTGVTLVNRAPHAFLFELGTQVRHTTLGANRGAMPAGHVFVPIAEDRHRRAIDAIKRRILEHGAKRVVGDAA